MERTITDEVSAINNALAENIGPQKYEVWFKNSTSFTLGDGYVKIGVPNAFMAGWLQNHFAADINRAVRDIMGKNEKITFVIDPGLTGHKRRNSNDLGLPRLVGAQTGKKQTIGHQVKPRPQAGQRLRLSLDTFIVGRSNQLAYTAAKAVACEKQSSFNPLFVHGGYGVGKTHLLQGICNAVCQNRPETNWLYLSAEDFANQFILALKTKKLEAFRRRMRQTDLLAIDDVHFLASKPSTQEEFLHTFNAINLAGRQVVLASDSHPKLINQLSEKLVNRFVSGMVVKIESPDFETRCQICRQYVENMGKQVPETVIRFIAEKLRNNVRELEGALLKIVAYSSLQNEKISLSMAQSVLVEHLARTDPIVHISDIVAATAAYFGITTADIHSPRKDNTVAMARHFSMYLARKHTKMSTPEIGRFLGNKNHATVLLACKKVEDQISRDAELHWHGPAGNKASTTKIVLAALEESIAS
jgi:chromosomal replication initiator protein